jgi:hypothetical protein
MLPGMPKNIRNNKLCPSIIKQLSIQYSFYNVILFNSYVS